MLTLSRYQVCINQQDVVEQRAQVALMGLIYQQCSRALIWLGCDASECNLHGRDDEEDKRRDELNDPFALTRLYDKHIDEWPCFAMSEDRNSVVFEQDTAFDDLWKRYVKVCDSPWWTLFGPCKRHCSLRWLCSCTTPGACPSKKSSISARATSRMSADAARKSTYISQK